MLVYVCVSLHAMHKTIKLLSKTLYDNVPVTSSL